MSNSQLLLRRWGLLGTPPFGFNAAVAYTEYTTLSRSADHDHERKDASHSWNDWSHL